MRTKKLVPYCLAVLLAGCVPVFSLHPLYTKETVTFDERLLGTWLVDPNKPEETWEFARLEASAAGRLPVDVQDQAAKCYRMTFTVRDGKLSVVGCLVKLQSHLFLDLLPERLPGAEQDPEKVDFLSTKFFLPVHTFVRVSFSGDQLKIGLTDDGGFKKLLKAEPKAVMYTLVKENPMTDKVDEYALLTASTQDLQTFVTKYADDERLFTKGDPLTRKASSTAK